MPGKQSIILTKIFNIVYVLCFGWVLFFCIFANVVYSYNIFALLAIMALYGIVFLLSYRIFRTNADRRKRYGGLVCAGVILFTGTLQLINGFAMRYDPAYDLWAIYGGGITWAENGTLAVNEYFLAYFHMFPDNLGGAFLFRCLFGLTNFLGFRDYYAIALVFNVILLQISLVLVYDILRRIAGHSAGMLGLLMFLLFPPFYMMGAVFYTDLLSVVPPILAVDLFILAKKQKNPVRRTALYAVLGLAVGVGAVVKFSVTITLVAVGIATLLVPPRWGKGRFIQTTLLPIIMAVTGFIIVITAWGSVKTTTLDEARLEREAMPFSHWVAMGLIGDGGYDEADYDRAMKLPSRTVRDEVNMELIKARLTEPAMLDLAKLFTRKAIRCFGDGTYDLGIFLDDGPHDRVLAHEFVLRDGAYYSAHRYFSQGAYLTMFALSLVPPMQAAFGRRQGCRALRIPLPWLCLFGLFLFLMIWETNSRYTLNYMPILVVCACLGVTFLPVSRHCQKVRIACQEIRDVLSSYINK